MVSGRSDRIESISQIVSTIEDKDDKSEEDLYAMARGIAIEKGITVATSAARSKGYSFKFRSCSIDGSLGSYPDSEVIHEKSAVEVSYVPGALRVMVKVVGSLNNEPVERATLCTNDLVPLFPTGSYNLTAHINCCKFAKSYVISGISILCRSSQLHC